MDEEVQNSRTFGFKYFLPRSKIGGGNGLIAMHRHHSSYSG
jgi:hypothetical protein